jgi:hypothetical protein
MMNFVSKECIIKNQSNGYDYMNENVNNGKGRPYELKAVCSQHQ